MALGLLAGGQFLLFVREFFGYLCVAGGTGDEFRARLGVHDMIIAFDALVFAVHAVVAARVAAFAVIFLAVYQMVAITAFHVFLVGTVVKRNRLLGS